MSFLRGQDDANRVRLLPERCTPAEHLRAIARVAVIAMALSAFFWLGSAAAYAVTPAGVVATPGVPQADPGGGAIEAVLFYLLGGATVVSAIGICWSRNIVRMAVWLFITLGSVAMLYFLLAAPFLAAIQLIIYAGGTLILLVFGVMLTSKSPWARFDPPRHELAAAVVVCGVMLACLCIVLIGHDPWQVAEVANPGKPVSALGRALMTEYLVPFEVAGILLFVVMVGAAHLARQERS